MKLKGPKQLVRPNLLDSDRLRGVAVDTILRTLGYAMLGLIGLVIVLGLIALVMYEINWIIRISLRPHR